MAFHHIFVRRKTSATRTVSTLAATLIRILSRFVNRAVPCCDEYLEVGGGWLLERMLFHLLSCIVLLGCFGYFLRFHLLILICWYYTRNAEKCQPDTLLRERRLFVGILILRFLRRGKVGENSLFRAILADICFKSGGLGVCQRQPQDGTGPFRRSIVTHRCFSDRKSPSSDLRGGREAGGVAEMRWGVTHGCWR